jgi:hypothetical protein
VLACAAHGNFSDGHLTQEILNFRTVDGAPRNAGE